jgi:hypothetical protein
MPREEAQGEAKAQCNLNTKRQVGLSLPASTQLLIMLAKSGKDLPYQSAQLMCFSHLEISKLLSTSSEPTINKMMIGLAVRNLLQMKDSVNGSNNKA